MPCWEMFTVAVTCVAVAFTLLTVMPVDGENCTLVTPERLEPLMNRNGPVPACPLVGFRDVIWGAGDGVWIAKASASVLEVPAGDETETFRGPGAAL